VIFDGRFFFQGHIGFWDADRKQLLGTLTNPAPNGTIDYIDWGPQTYGYMGWARIPGVVDARRMVVHPGEQTSFVLGGNPYGPISMSGKFWARWDALNTMGTPLSAPGIINPLGLALPQIGFPREEATTIAGRRMQKFERCWLAEQDAPEPYDVVSLLLTELPA
jgi:hypothetical protein